MLPAEEAAINRALYASLMNDKKDSPLKNTIKTESMSCDETDIEPSIKIKVENVEEEVRTLPSHFEQHLDKSIEYIDVDAISSPELSSESEGSTPSKGFEQRSPSSNPASPLSYRSTNSLHLCLSSGSSSSSSWSSFESHSDSESLSPWCSPAPKIPKRTKGSSNKALKSKRTLNFEASNGTGGGKKGKIGKRGPKGKGRLQTAKKSAIQVAIPLDIDSNSRGSRDSSVSKDPPYQAQRKFASNCPPPVR